MRPVPNVVGIGGIACLRGFEVGEFARCHWSPAQPGCTRPFGSWSMTRSTSHTPLNCVVPPAQQPSIVEAELGHPRVAVEDDVSAGTLCSPCLQRLRHTPHSHSQPKGALPVTGCRRAKAREGTGCACHALPGSLGIYIGTMQMKSQENFISLTCLDRSTCCQYHCPPEL